MPEAQWHQVRRKREEPLRACGGDQRRRHRRGLSDVDQGVQDELAVDEQELGHELAEQCLPQRPEPILQGQARRRPRCHGKQHRTVQLVLRGYLHIRSQLLLVAS